MAATSPSAQNESSNFVVRLHGAKAPEARKITADRASKWLEPMGWALLVKALCPGWNDDAAYHSNFGFANIYAFADGDFDLLRPGGTRDKFFYFEHELRFYTEDGSHDTNEDPGFPPVIRTRFLIDWLDQNYPNLDANPEEDRSAMRGEAEFWRNRIAQLPKVELFSEEDIAALDRLKRRLTNAEILALARWQ